MSARAGFRFVFALLPLVVAFTAVPTALAQCDTVGPAITSFTLSPTSVNTTSGPANVNCTMVLTDSPAGVSSATCALQWWDGMSKFQTQSCTATTPSSGTPQSGTYQCTITLPRYSAQGTWNAQVTTEDAVTNPSFYNYLQLPGTTTSISVTSNPDTTAPGLTSATLNPTSVNVSSADQNVTCTMTVTDALSGVAIAGCFVQGPTLPGGAQSQACVDDAPNSGTRNNGTFSCTITIPRYSDAGTWTTAVFLVDQVGNSASLPASPTLNVTSSPEDVTPPVIGAFDFNPKTANAATGPTVVTCTIPITDSPAGVTSAGCSFSPLFTAQQTQSCSSDTPSSGTRNSGTFSCNVVIPRYSAPGDWFATVDAVDRVGNSSSIEPATPLSVTCGGGGDAEANIRFQQGSRTTLVWDAIAGATRYNIYRGNLTTIATSYGTCQNARDPILTDTQFVDTDVPNATQKGFHYLVSYYTSGGMEKGLGADSDGEPRTVSAPCP